MNNLTDKEKIDYLEDKIDDDFDLVRNGLILRVRHEGDLSVDGFDDLVRTDYVSDDKHVTTFVPKNDELDEGVIF